MMAWIKRHKIALLIFWFAFIAIACNLSSSTRPPTIVPRSSPTPPPTIGFATLSPAELPSSIATPHPDSNVELLNLINQIETDRLMLHVDALASLRTRHVNSQGINQAYDYIRGEFDKITQQTGNLFVFTHEFPLEWAGTRTIQRNIAAVISGDEIGAGTILISAHYDSISQFPEDSVVDAPGANDNASGVATLIELARIMSQRPHRSTIMFVAFSAEEVGRRGSLAFMTDYISSQGIEIDAMINLDIIGSSTGPNGINNDRQMRVFSANPNESLSRQLARSMNLIAFNHAPDMELIVENAEDRQNRYSDHLSFSERGFPAVRLIEAAEEPNRTNTSNDTIDDVQASYLTRSAQTVLVTVTSLADGLRPPRNVSLRDNGGGVRQLVWEQVPGATSYVVALRRPNSLIYDQQFETTENSVTWDGFVPTRFAGVAIAARDENGLIGPLTEEILIQ